MIPPARQIPSAPWRRGWILAGSAALLGLIAIYVVTPVGWDQSVSLAYARLADHQGPFPENVVRSWLSRGFGYKVYIYGLHRAATVFSDFDDKQRYEIAIRSVAATVILTLLLAAVLSSRRFLVVHGIAPFDAFFVLCAAHFGLSHWVAFQPEELAALLTILGVALILSSPVSFAVLGGVLLALTASLKGITVLVGLSGLAAVPVLCRREGRGSRTLTAALAFFLALGGMGVIAAVGFPSEIQDLWEMAIYNRSSELAFPQRVKQMAAMLASWPHVPILAVGGPAAAAVALFLAARKEARLLLFYLLAWALAFSGPLAQAKGFAYHAAGMIPLLAASTLALAVFLARNDSLRRFALVPLILVVVMAPPGLFARPMGRFQEHSAFLHRVKEVLADRREFKEMGDLYALSTEPSLLYLDWGLAAYYWGAPSHLRHFIPLPLQRSNPALQDTEPYRRALSEALHYNGRYVVLNPRWFPLDRPDLAELKRKIEREYLVVGATIGGMVRRGERVNGVKLFERRTPEDWPRVGEAANAVRETPPMPGGTERRPE
jgi:hypothetical protein